MYDDRNLGSCNTEYYTCCIGEHDEACVPITAHESCADVHIESRPCVCVVSILACLSVYVTTEAG